MVSVNADNSQSPVISLHKKALTEWRHTNVKLQSNVETSVCSGLLKEEIKMKARWNVKRDRVREGVGMWVSLCVWVKSRKALGMWWHHGRFGALVGSVRDSFCLYLPRAAQLQLPPPTHTLLRTTIRKSAE